jgi:hypothetical protein
MVNFMRSLLLAEQFYDNDETGSESEAELIFTFSDKPKVAQRIWHKLNSKFPEIHVQGIGLYKSDLLMIRDVCFRTHKGYYEINSGHERWIDISGNEITNVTEWMSLNFSIDNYSTPTTSLRS